jgi:MoaA/NifB/PqqE/SkfB family radical SAM enzyme
MSITKRLNRITKIPKEYLTETPPVPKSVKIELTPRCNYNCLYCGYSFREKQPTEDMSWRLFTSIAQELKELKVEEIGPFYIGEPFANPELLVKAISFLKKDLKIPYVFLTTNSKRMYGSRFG